MLGSVLLKSTVSRFAAQKIERGVRMVQVSLSIDGYDIAWDTGHDDIQGGHARLAKACDQGIAALITD
jgi:hypothetical protein